MSIELRTVMAPDRGALERLVQLAIGQGWRRIGAPAEVDVQRQDGEAQVATADAQELKGECL